MLSENKALVSPAQPSASDVCAIRGGKDPPFAQCGAHDAGNARFLNEMRRVDNADVDRDWKVAKLVEHADRDVMSATDDRQDDKQVDV